MRAVEAYITSDLISAFREAALQCSVTLCKHICIHKYIYIYIYVYTHIVYIYILFIYIQIYTFISLNVYKCLMCCAATDRTACESGQVKNTEIQQRLPWFRTLGMTLSRGKSPQAAKHPPFCNIMLVLVHHRPIRPSVRPFTRSLARHLFSGPFLSATTLYFTHTPSSSATGLSTTTTVLSGVWERRRNAVCPSRFIFNILFGSLSHPPSTRPAIPTIFSNFYAAPSFLFGTCRYVTVYRFMVLRFISAR